MGECLLLFFLLFSSSCMFVELSFTLDDLKICFARKKEVAA